MADRFGVFDDLIRSLETLSHFGKQFERVDLTTAIRENARQKATGRIHAKLVEVATSAINSIEEFQYGPLKERFLENIRRPGHVYITHDLTVSRVFSPKIAGTIQDLEAGLYQSGASHDQRLAVWKFGIYLPFRYSTDRHRRWESLPTYPEVIEERLEAWEDKAPFWVFIEYGNQGGNEAFPSFAGTGFIEQVLASVDTILQEAIREAEIEISSGLEQAVEEQFAQPIRIVRTELQRVDVGRTPAGQLIQIITKESAAGAYYQWVIGGRFAAKLTSGEAAAYIK